MKSLAALAKGAGGCCEHCGASMPPMVTQISAVDSFGVHHILEIPLIEEKIYSVALIYFCDLPIISVINCSANFLPTF